MFIQLFYTLYLDYMEKKVKYKFIEMICLLIVLHIVFEIHGKESKVHVY